MALESNKKDSKIN
ncbi:hypothetical protein FH142_11915 [Staphylococcus warneri]|nr:hypothetical protein [Staphylococcus succinus]MCC9112478.1 hypothetical protein [Staphylococcus capitis]MCH4517959.1 hypothetical protein [Staphylococcus haemolyticus]MCI2768067.1 hypothetical protein [Staphylococcus warneri]MCI2942231.1 hypothetical protein [Staphylococcus cohnii]MCT1652782.1 hypothetical protein [Staphylococcus saprophyticus]